MTRQLGVRLALLGALGLVSACSQILGIEDAHVDSSLEAAGSGATSSGASASGGNVATQASSGAGSQGHAGHAGTMPASTGGGGSSGAVPSDMGTGGAPSEPTLCERYCDQVSAHCTGKYEQYRTFDQCVEVCKRLPEGEPDDDDINTVSCRLRQAEYAASEPFVYCKSAGPLGAGRCGFNCIAYCSMMQATCTSESTAGNLELSYFASSQDCLEACSALPSDEQGPAQYSSSASAEPSSFVGNHVYCRTYHVAAALEQNTPDEHCPHAMGGEPCNAQ